MLELPREYQMLPVILQYRLDLLYGPVSKETVQPFQLIFIVYQDSLGGLKSFDLEQTPEGSSSAARTTHSRYTVSNLVLPTPCLPSLISKMTKDETFLRLREDT